MPDSRLRSSLPLAWLIVGLLAAVMLGVTYRYTINFPFWDDFYALMDFLALSKQPISVGTWWAGLFEQHYEHRIATSRLIAWLQFIITGKFSPVGLIMFCNVVYAATAFFFLKYLNRREHATPALMVLIACFLFTPNQWETLSWATTALFMLLMIAFVWVSAILWQSEKSYAFIGTVMVALLATFSGANGILLFPSLLLVDVLRGKWRERRFVLLLICMVLVAAWYFWGYSRPAHQQPFGSVLWQNPLLSLRYALVFLGNVFNAGINRAYIWGVACVVMIAWLIYRKVWKYYPVATSSLVFGLATIAVSTAGRAAIGPTQATVLRYISISAPISAMLVSLSLAMLPKETWKKYLAPIATMIGLLALAWSYHNMWGSITGSFEKYQAQKERMSQGKLSQFNYGSEFDNKTMAKKWLALYDSLGVYTFKGADEQHILSGIPIKHGALGRPKINASSDAEIGTLHLTYGSSSPVKFVGLSFADSVGNIVDFTLFPAPEENAGNHNRVFATAHYLADLPPNIEYLMIEATDEKIRDSFWIAFPESWKRIKK